MYHLRTFKVVANTDSEITGKTLMKTFATDKTNKRDKQQAGCIPVYSHFFKAGVLLSSEYILHSD